MSSEEEDLQEQQKAAVKIQSVFRGRQVRKQGNNGETSETGQIIANEEATTNEEPEVKESPKSIPKNTTLEPKSEPEPVLVQSDSEPRYTLAEIESILKNKNVNIDDVSSPRDRPITIFLQSITKREEAYKEQQNEVKAQNESLRRKLSELEIIVQNQSTKIKELQSALKILQKHPSKEEDVQALVKSMKYSPGSISPPKWRGSTARSSLPRPEASPTEKMLERLEQIKTTYTTLVKIPENNPKKKTNGPPLVALEKGFVL